MELGRFQHGQALGGEHNVEYGARGGKRGAQLGKALAALEKRGANFLIAPVHRVIICAAAARHPAHQRAEFIGFLASGEQPIGIGGHDLRQGHQPRSVPRGSGIENEVIKVGFLHYERSYAFQ